jgi:1-acyl-sn-glycerol-3-phosphate acyltransferase
MLFTFMNGIGYLLNFVFVDRKNRRQAVLTLKDGIEKLKAGHSLIIFPKAQEAQEKI